MNNADNRRPLLFSEPTPRSISKGRSPVGGSIDNGRVQDLHLFRRDLKKINTNLKEIKVDLKNTVV